MREGSLEYSGMVKTMRLSECAEASSPTRWGLVGMLLVAAALYRWPFHMTYPVMLPSDEQTIWLMAKDILRGETPVFFYGQSFHGTLDAYLTAVFVHLLGSSLLSLRLGTFIVAVLFMFAVYLVGRRFGGERVGLLTLAAMVFPPMFQATSHMPHYMLHAFSVPIILLVVHKVLYRQGSISPRQMTLLGFLSGLAWWENNASVHVLVVAWGMVLASDKRLFLRGAFWAAVLGFIGGSLPVWIHSTQAGWQSFQGSLATVHDIKMHATNLLANAGPVLLGWWPEVAWRWFSVPLYVAALTWLTLRLGGDLLTSLFRLKPPRHPAGLLLAVLAVTLIVNVISVYGSRLSDVDQKYLLSLYAIIPVAVGMFADRLSNWYRPAGAAFVGLLAAVHIVQGAMGHEWLRREAWLNSDLVRPRIEGVEFLKSADIQHVYGDFFLGRGIAFASDEDVIAADPYEEGFVPYAKEVDTAERIGFVLQGESPGLEGALKGLGAAFRKTRVSPYWVYHDFSRIPQDWEEVAPQNWKVDAAVNAEAASVMLQ
jgi:4-amino-4-deoxy-L-arabinose transferase-like glycosyltransferase